MIERLRVEPRGQGLVEVTESVMGAVARAGFSEGLCTLFIQHTSASLLIQENADPSAQRDLESWLARLVPENDPLYTHTQERPRQIRPDRYVDLDSDRGRTAGTRNLAGRFLVGASASARHSHDRDPYRRLGA